jgi:ribosomal protein S21
MVSTLKQQDYKMESSDAYRAFKASLNKDTTEKEMDAKERYLYWKLRRKTQRATMFTLTRPEVVLPTYMASAFGLDKGVSCGYNRN